MVQLQSDRKIIASAKKSQQEDRKLSIFNIRGLDRINIAPKSITHTLRLYDTHIDTYTRALVTTQVN